MNTNDTIDAFILKIEVLKEGEEGQLMGGVSSFSLESSSLMDDTNYFQCSCNNYQCHCTVVEKPSKPIN